MRMPTRTIPDINSGSRHADPPGLHEPSTVILPDVTLRLLILLIAGSTSALASDPPASPNPVIRQDLPERSGQKGALRDWQSLPPRGKSRLGITLDGPPPARNQPPSLHFRYALTASAPVLDAVDPVDGVGLKLDLHRLDASHFDHLELQIRGDATEGFNPELEIQFRRPDPAAEGMEQTGSYTLRHIGADWQSFSIPLHALPGIQDWRDLSSLVIVLPEQSASVRKGGYFMAGLALTRTGQPGPGADDRLEARDKQRWEQAHGGDVAARPLLKARLTGWPTVALIQGASLPRDDRLFLQRLALDTWRGVDALTDRVHGLPLDRIEFQSGSLAAESTHIGDYTNITTIGLHLLAVTAAYELKLIDRAQALRRLTLTLDTLNRLETCQGFLYNYYNTTTLERTSHFISFVDSAWLTAGLIVLRQAFPELAARCSHLINRTDYRFFRDDGHPLMSHGYYTHLGVRSPYHYGMFYTEARLGSLIAIGKGEAPQEHWFRMARTLPAKFRWQSGTPVDRRMISAGGHTWIGGHYHWQHTDFVPSWGGSLFEALMPTLVLDELRHAPDSLGLNDRVHTQIHRRVALEQLNYPVWGMSPSSTPGSRAYAEYGIHELGVAGYPSGVVTPHAAALALYTEPEAATRNLRRLAEDFPLYGDFGFYDAVNPRTGEVSPHYLCLNQAMILIALANHLTNGAIQKHFAADPIISATLPLLKIERFTRSNRTKSGD